MTIFADDRKLLDGFRNGEPHSLEKVYRTYFADVVKFLQNGFSIRKGSEQYFFKGYKQSWRLEGAVQEVFTRAFSSKARESYDGLRPYRNYLLMIARNYAINTFHKRSREFVILDSDDFDSLSKKEDDSKTDVSPEQTLVDNQLKKHVSTFIESMQSDEKQLFKLRFEKGHSIMEVAKQLGCTEYRVKQNEKQLRLKFFKEMKELGYFDGYSMENEQLNSTVFTIFIIAYYFGEKL